MWRKGWEPGKAGRKESKESKESKKHSEYWKQSLIDIIAPERSGATRGVGRGWRWRWRWPRRSGRWQPLGMSPNLTTFSPTMSASAKMRFFPFLMHPTGSAFFLAPRSNLVKSQVRQSGPHFDTIAVCYVEMLCWVLWVPSTETR